MGVHDNARLASDMSLLGLTAKSDNGVRPLSTIYDLGPADYHIQITKSKFN